MGLNYSINLYFPSRRIEVALRALAKLAPAGQETVIRLSDGEVSVPFTSCLKYDPVDLSVCGTSIELETSLLFPVDEAIDNFSHGYEPVGDTGMAQIGYISLTVRLGCLYSEFSFMAATSSISRLFVASNSIRSRFQELLAAAGGVCGWLDQEDFEFRRLNDPSQTFAPEFVEYHESLNPSPDGVAAAVFKGLGGRLPAVESLEACRTPDTIGLAQSIHADKAFDVLPILADALQELGLENEDVLAHLRGPAVHDKDCFVVDLLRGKRD